MLGEMGLMFCSTGVLAESLGLWILHLGESMWVLSSIDWRLDNMDGHLSDFGYRNGVDLTGSCVICYGGRATDTR